MITQIDLVTGICELLDRLQPGIGLLPRQANAVIAAADSILAEWETPERKVAPAMGLSAWLASDGTGLASRHMAHVLVGYWGRNSNCYHYPHDSDDFGRCLGLLAAAPELQERVWEMAAAGAEWAALVAVWDELTVLYECGEFRQVSDRIYELTRLAPGSP